MSVRAIRYAVNVARARSTISCGTTVGSSGRSTTCPTGKVPVVSSRSSSIRSSPTATMSKVPSGWASTSVSWTRQPTRNRDWAPWSPTS